MTKWTSALVLITLLLTLWGCDDDVNYSSATTNACTTCDDTRAEGGDPVSDDTPTTPADDPDPDPDVIPDDGALNNIPDDVVPDDPDVPDPDVQPTCTPLDRELVGLGELVLGEGVGELVDVDVHDNIAYITHQRGLRIVDVSDPGAPQLLGTSQVAAGTAAGLVVSDDKDNRLGYLAVTGDGLRVFDLDDPTQPRELGAFDLTGQAGAEYANDLVLVGDLVYVAALAQGFWAIDVSDPSRPTPLGGCCSDRSRHPLAGPSDVAVVGDRAFVTDTEGFFRTHIISDPVNPNILTTLELGSPGRAIRVLGDRAYVATDDGLAVIDVSDPVTPGLLTSVGLEGGGVELALAHGLIFMASGEGGLVILNPESNAAAIGWGDNASAVEVVGDRVYVVGGDRLEILDFVCPGVTP